MSKKIRRLLYWGYNNLSGHRRKKEGKDNENWRIKEMKK
jgi:hypothetical protein